PVDLWTTPRGVAHKPTGSKAAADNPNLEISSLRTTPGSHSWQHSYDLFRHLSAGPHSRSHSSVELTFNPEASGPQSELYEIRIQGRSANRLGLNITILSRSDGALSGAILSETLLPPGKIGTTRLIRGI